MKGAGDSILKSCTPARLAAGSRVGVESGRSCCFRGPWPPRPKREPSQGRGRTEGWGLACPRTHCQSAALPTWILPSRGQIAERTERSQVILESQGISAAQQLPEGGAGAQLTRSSFPVKQSQVISVQKQMLTLEPALGPACVKLHIQSGVSGTNHIIKGQNPFVSQKCSHSQGMWFRLILYETEQELPK